MNKKEKAAAFRELYDAYFTYIFRYVYKRIPRKEDVEDIVSDVFTVVWNSIETIDTSRNDKAFIFGIARHKIADFLRQYYKLEIKRTDIEFDEIVYDSERDTNDTFENHQKIVELLLKELDDREKHFFDLKYRNQCSYAEIAKELNITKNNAKVINNRLVKKLKDLWEKTI